MVRTEEYLSAPQSPLSLIPQPNPRLRLLHLGMTSKKKLADLRTLSQLSLPPLPLRPIRTNFNWDIFEHCYPSPPSCN